MFNDLIQESKDPQETKSEEIKEKFKRLVENEAKKK